MKYDYDLFVIGAGSGGIRAARISAQFGAKVAIAEERFLGGTCVNVGCIPKKLLVYASHFEDEFQDANGYGFSIPKFKFNWQTLIQNKNKEIKRLNGIYEDILTKSGVTLLEGKATILDPHHIQIEDQTISSERILIAVGGTPYIPDFPGKEHVISSEQAFFLKEFPKKVIVVGGGYIGVEFAGVFNGLGADTTQLYHRDLFLRGFDQEIRQFLADTMQQKGIHLQWNQNIVKVEKNKSTLVATLKNGKQQTADIILYATGRIPKTKGLGLENVNVQLDSSGAIIVNEAFQTNVPSIYALGDVINRVQLTPVALAEGMNFAKNIYGKQKEILNYQWIPTAVFSQPEFSTVGFTEEEAQKKYKKINVFHSSFTPLKLTLSKRKEKMFFKMIVDENSDQVVGVHVIGTGAAEIVQGIAVAMKAGATKTVFDQTIGIHPTVAEELVTMRTPSR